MRRRPGGGLGRLRFSSFKFGEGWGREMSERGSRIRVCTFDVRIAAVKEKEKEEKKKKTKTLGGRVDESNGSEMLS